MTLSDYAVLLERVARSSAARFPTFEFAVRGTSIFVARETKFGQYVGVVWLGRLVGDDLAPDIRVTSTPPVGGCSVQILGEHCANIEDLVAALVYVGGRLSDKAVTVENLWVDDGVDEPEDENDDED